MPNVIAEREKYKSIIGADLNSPHFRLPNYKFMLFYVASSSIIEIK
jgi:hypothetical protein